MLQVARLAPKILGEATELLTEFLRSQQNKDGGFRNRSQESDLYYTVFGLESLLAVNQPPRIDPSPFIASAGKNAHLDLVHLSSLARCQANLQTAPPGEWQMSFIPPSTDQKKDLTRRLESFRTSNGGYHALRGQKNGTAYGAFLALGAYQDLEQDLPSPNLLVQSLKDLETPDGAWANETVMSVGSTNATAAAVTLLRNLRQPIQQTAGEWILQRFHQQGGFRATPQAPIPDLLSTATAVHALAGLQYPLEKYTESCLDYIDTLWTNEGSFHGHWQEDFLDTEYTYYGLLALGHLSLFT